MKTVRLKSVFADRDGLLVRWDGNVRKAASGLVCDVVALEARQECRIAAGQSLTVLLSNVADGEEVEA